MRTIAYLTLFAGAGLLLAVTGHGTAAYLTLFGGMLLASALYRRTATLSRTYWSL